MRTFFLSLLIFSLIGLTVGCKKGKNEVEINGNCTINGEPIDLGVIQFFNDTSEGGGNVQEGKYTAKVPPGDLKVRIRGYRFTGPEPEIPELKPGDPPAPPPQRPREAITSEDLWQKPTFTIKVDKAGTYDINFEE